MHILAETWVGELDLPERYFEIYQYGNTQFKLVEEKFMYQTYFMTLLASCWVILWYEEAVMIVIVW